MNQPRKNRLVESLPQEIREALTARLQPVSLPTRTNLFTLGERPRYVHFLTSGVASQVTTLAEGNVVEVGLVGFEGCPEKLHMIGPQVGMMHCFMQVEGAGLRLGMEEFERDFFSLAEVRRRILESVQHEALVMGQLVACNRLHELEERLARWLLMVHDRVQQPEIPLTQEFVAEMLGSRRSTVNLAMGSLQRSGVVEYRRGRVRIEDRERLEEVSCECYPVIGGLFRGLHA